MATNIVKQLQLSDGTSLECSGLRFITLSDKGNVQISSLEVGSTDWGDGSTAAKGNLNIEPFKNVKIKPGDGGQVEIIADNTGDVDEVVLKAVTSVDADGAALDDDKTIRLKINTSELELNNKDADDTSAIDLKFRTGKSSNKKYVESKIKAKSIDLRANAANEKEGSGGGIAVQIASCDSNFKENKFKIETSRKKDVAEGLPTTSSEWSNFYDSEGGNGIEIGTINSQFESLYTDSMRRGKNTKVYATSRGTIVTDTETGKTDYPTQPDDSKDIIDADHPNITWIDIINAAAYLKQNELIPSDGTFYKKS